MNNTHEQQQLAEIEHPSALLRISTDKTDFSGKKVDFEETLKNHQEKISLFFKEQGWKLQENENLYKEVLSGGTEYENRPELIQLMKNMHKYDAIVVMEIQRLARQSHVSSLIKKEIEKYGVLIITLNPFKVWDVGRNLSDSFQYDIYASMSEYERKVASVRVKANKMSMARQGLNSSGSVPMGYIRNPQTKKLEIEMVKGEDGNLMESKNVKTVKYIYHLYLNEGLGVRGICDRLNSMGIKNKNGNTWIANSLRVILTTETYKGTLVARNYENVKGKRVVTETVSIPENHPAIIDVETWDKVATLMDKKKLNSGVDRRSKDWNSKKHISILDGLVFCNVCDRKSTIKYTSARKTPAFYIIRCTKFNATDQKQCNNGGIAVKDVEQIVFQKLLKYKDELENRIAKYSDNDFEMKTNDLQEQQAMLEQNLKRLIAMMKILNKQETEYELEKELSGIEDKEQEKMLAENKKQNQEERLQVMNSLEEVKRKLESTPSAEEEIKKLNQKLDIINELQTNKDLDKRSVNVKLKQIIHKIYYERILPDNYKQLPNVEKENYPATIGIEYHD